MREDVKSGQFQLIGYFISSSFDYRLSWHSDKWSKKFDPFWILSIKLWLKKEKSQSNRLIKLNPKNSLAKIDRLMILVFVNAFGVC